VNLEAPSGSASVQHYLRQAVAPSTRDSYETGVNRWRAFCEFRHWNPEGQITTQRLEEWLAAMGDEGRISVATIRVYKTGLAAYYRERCPAAASVGPTPFVHPRLEDILSGIEREQATKRRLLDRQPGPTKTEGVTFDMVLALINSLPDHEGSGALYPMNVAASAMAVGTALRPSELLGSRKLPDRVIRRGQLSFFASASDRAPLASGAASQPHHCVLSLHINKTNQTCLPKPRAIGVPPFVATLWTWYNRQARLFQEQGVPLSGSTELFKLPLRTQSLLSFLQRHLSSLGYTFSAKLTGKAFRIGGTSTLAAAGAPSQDIRALGGWSQSSQVWRTYASVDSHKQRALLTQQQMFKLLSAPASSD
jgi:hypothetical protein